MNTIVWTVPVARAQAFGISLVIPACSLPCTRIGPAECIIRPSRTKQVACNVRPKQNPKSGIILYQTKLCTKLSMAILHSAEPVGLVKVNWAWLRLARLKLEPTVIRARYNMDWYPAQQVTIYGPAYHITQSNWSWWQTLHCSVTLGLAEHIFQC